MIPQTNDAANLTIGQTASKIARRVLTSEQTKRWKQALKAAEQIRQQLADRNHSDSTELLAEERQRKEGGETDF